jgi:fluoroquinolone transport system ATP-binding protein
MIQVRDLGFTYPGARDAAIEGISFSIEKGEIFGFLGPNGSGKSTTQKVIIGLLKGYRGEIAVLGRDLRAWGPDYYEQIGVCFELPNSYSKLTARENLEFFSSFYRRTAFSPGELLDMVGLADTADKQVGSFSKGMKMKLNLARSLLHDPPVLFLDEPTSGLDPASARRVKDLIVQKKQEGKTIFLTTHNMAVADELCDTVSFIVHGRISVTERPRDLRMRFGKRVVRVEYTLGGDRNHAEFPLDGLGRNSAFVEILRRGTIQTIHSEEATMEDIFLSVTGRSLE